MKGKRMAVTTVTGNIVACVDCGGSFERPVQRGRPAVRCLSCREAKQGRQVRLDNGSKIDSASVDLIVDGVAYVEAAEPCRDCGRNFLRPKRRGKPPVRCIDCKSKEDAEKAEEITVPQETLEERFKGAQALLKGTPGEIPKGAEAQCPGIRGCGRIFTSDSACEDHKVYGANGNLAQCKDPATLGMVPKERRGLPVWTRPTERVF